MERSLLLLSPCPIDTTLHSLAESIHFLALFPAVTLIMTSYIPSITFPGKIFSIPAISILVPIALGTGVGFSVQPRDTQKTYLALKQPPYRPPPQVFGPVWTILYGLMGYSAYRAWTNGMSSLNPQTIEYTKVNIAPC